LLRRERIDVLHLKDPLVAIVVQHALRAGLCSTRTVLSHGTEEPAEFQRRITYLQHLAPWHREQAEADEIWKETWRMIPNFVDTDQFRPGSSPDLRREFLIPAHAQVVLVSSAIRASHKRVDYLIDEFSQVRQFRPDAPIWLVIAGARENDTDRLVKKAEHLLGDCVRFAVNFPSARMPELYRMADLLIHGALKEMFGNVFLEAIASGVPCIVHHHPVMSWVVGDGGLALDLSAEGNLADAIIGLCENKAERDRLGTLARKHCCRRFNNEVVVDQFLRYYEHVVGRPRMAA
jgi:glycosyltransferase involved in cell wall biosynthesis